MLPSGKGDGGVFLVCSMSFLKILQLNTSVKHHRWAALTARGHLGPTEVYAYKHMAQNVRQRINADGVDVILASILAANDTSTAKNRPEHAKTQLVNDCPNTSFSNTPDP